MAFVFLNHYLDIRDAIADGAQSTIDLDHSDFLDTDIPNDCELNDKTLVPNDLHDAVKEWVLTASMDGNIQQVTIPPHQFNTCKGVTKVDRFCI
jgi:hypothetical protein